MLVFTYFILTQFRQKEQLRSICVLKYPTPVQDLLPSRTADTELTARQKGQLASCFAASHSRKGNPNFPVSTLFMHVPYSCQFVLSHSVPAYSRQSLIISIKTLSYLLRHTQTLTHISKDTTVIFSENEEWISPLLLHNVMRDRQESLIVVS